MPLDWSHLMKSISRGKMIESYKLRGLIKLCCFFWSLNVTSLQFKQILLESLNWKTPFKGLYFISIECWCKKPYLMEKKMICIHDPLYLGRADRSADQQSSHFWCSPRGSCGGARVDDLQGQLRARKRKKTKGLQRASGGGAGTHLACLSCRERANVDVFGYKKNKVHGVVICTWPSTFAFPGEAAAAPLTCVFTWNMRSARSTQLRPEQRLMYAAQSLSFAWLRRPTFSTAPPVVK